MGKGRYGSLPSKDGWLRRFGRRNSGETCRASWDTDENLAICGSLLVGTYTSYSVLE